MSDTLPLTQEEKMLLAWKAGLTFTRPLASALVGLQEKGFVSEGDILSSKLTEHGRSLVEQWTYSGKES